MHLNSSGFGLTALRLYHFVAGDEHRDDIMIALEIIIYLSTAAYVNIDRHSEEEEQEEEQE